MSANAIDLTAPSGAAGGALSGTYPNPGIAVPENLQTTAGANPVFGAGATGDTNNRCEIRANGNLLMGTGAAPPDVNLFRVSGPKWQMSQPLNVSGSVDILTAGAGLAVAEGSNAKQGTAILSAGTVVVANTSVTANSRIFLTLVALGTVTVPSALGVTARTAGTSFTILASQATDTSTVAYEIIEPG